MKDKDVIKEIIDNWKVFGKGEQLQEPFGEMYTEYKFGSKLVLSANIYNNVISTPN